MHLEQCAEALRRAALGQHIDGRDDGDVSGADEAKPVMEMQSPHEEMHAPPARVSADGQYDDCYDQQRSEPELGVSCQ